MHALFKLFLFAVAAALVAYFQFDGIGDDAGKRKAPPRSTETAPARAGQSWGNPSSLPDHFARHGADFGARNANEYAQMAAQFLQRARTEGLPAKVDNSGVLRVFDYRTGSFGAYNRDGTTKTFFKPGNSGYFARQPGRSINLRMGR